MVQTTTKGILHFEDLEPKMFEKMYLDILVASKKYEDIRWYGLGGSDGGIDIKFTSIEDGLKYFAQCKRYKALSASGLKKIVDRIVKDAIDYKGQILWVISSCEISKKAYDSFEQYAIEKGFKKAYYKGRGILDSELHTLHSKILHRYFGIDYADEEKLLIKRIDDKKRGVKEVNDKLLRTFENLNSKRLLHLCQNPELRFVSSELIIKSLFDKVYPDSNDDEEPSTWFKTWSYDKYNEGIEIHMYAYTYAKIYLDQICNWYTGTNKPNGIPLLELKVNIIGRIPYYNIIDIEEDGDMFYGFPIITCRFDGEYGPIESTHFEFRDDELHLRIRFEEGKKVLIGQCEVDKLLQSQLVKMIDCNV